MTKERGRVFVLDTDDRARASTARFLASEGFAVRAFSEPEGILAGGLAGEPGCLLLEVKLGGVNGLEFVQEHVATGHHFAVIFLTAHGDVPTAVQAMRIGAYDFLEKPYDPWVLVNSVSNAIVAIRRQWETQSKLDDLRGRAASMTRRERQVIALMMQGLLNKEIASQLNLAEVTVKMHRSRAMQRLGAHNAAELTRIATLLELLPQTTEQCGGTLIT